VGFFSSQPHHTPGNMVSGGPESSALIKRTPAMFPCELNGILQ
jgi:hypothetical protein